MKLRLKPELNEWWRWEWDGRKWAYIHWDTGVGTWNVMKWLREVLK